MPIITKYSTLTPMRVCFFGTYTLDDGYPVNRTILKGLRAVGVEVEECHARLWRQPRHRWSSRGWFLSPFFWVRTIGVYLKLILNYFKVGQYDLMVVGYLGHQDLFLAKLLNLINRRPVVLIAFNSLYETVVQDRGLFSARSLIGLFLRWVDRTTCLLADLVLLDTQAHIEYFVKEFDLPPSKFLRAFVGSDLTISPTLAPVRLGQEPKFEVLFVGTYIPLHGIETIIRAAKVLEAEPDIHFTLLGQGQLCEEMRGIARRLGLVNLRFIDRWVPAAELGGYMAAARVCLGVFGRAEKAQRVIPCKVFDCLAMAKPLITADTPAVRELLAHGENALLCPAGDELSLARAILQLKKDPDLREKISKNGHAIYLKSCEPDVIGRSLMQAFDRLMESGKR
ncbi:MAG: glycosyltransferase [Nitrospiria bacterium]